jgi:ADP-ribose pyrophosphatase YjhB (NUDIX family)
MKTNSQSPQLSLAGVWPDGTTWKYYKNGDCTSLAPKAAFGIYIKDDAVLLTQNQRGWDIPGGTLEKFETIDETLVREMLEEGGLVVTEQLPIGYLLISLPNTQGTEVCIAGYRVETNQPLQSITGVECTAAKLCAYKSPELQSSAKKPLIDYIVQNLL